jgi:hypothetical protein
VPCQLGYSPSPGPVFAIFLEKPNKRTKGEKVKGGISQKKEREVRAGEEKNEFV